MILGESEKDSFRREFVNVRSENLFVAVTDFYFELQLIVNTRRG